jgi:stage IV sporulation protein FB
LLVAASALITGLFKEFIILFTIIIIHEIGHVLASLYYNFNINKIYLYPFGGHIKFDEKLNRPLKEEFIILISGPILQIVGFYLFAFLNYITLINFNTFNMIINYHYSLLLFNLLPIYPLDGSKLINIILSKFLSFKKSHILMIYISYIFLILSIIFLKYVSISVNIYLLLALLAIKTINEGKNHKDICNRFLLERYLYNFYFKTTKIIKGSKIYKMMRDKRHLFIIDNKEITEKELLKRRYTKNVKNLD